MVGRLRGVRFPQRGEGPDTDAALGATGSRRPVWKEIDARLERSAANPEGRCIIEHIDLEFERQEKPGRERVQSGRLETVLQKSRCRTVSVAAESPSGERRRGEHVDIPSGPVDDGLSVQAPRTLSEDEEAEERKERSAGVRLMPAGIGAHAPVAFVQNGEAVGRPFRPLVRRVFPYARHQFFESFEHIESRAGMEAGWTIFVLLRDCVCMNSPHDTA